MATKSSGAPVPSRVLDDPARAALLGPHAAFTEAVGAVLRYDPEVTIFGSLPPDPTPRDWRDAAELIGPAAMVATAGAELDPPPGWERVFRIPGVQMVDESLRTEPDPEASVLGPADVPEMLTLVDHAQPGPFLPRTIELGTYLGIRREGRLIAMAGERLHPPGWTEISAVCTHADFRGQGLATRLLRAVAHGIRERGEVPFLHASADNVNAIRLYEAIGFQLRRTLMFAGYSFAG